ncbi:MAG: GIDE domain-containing protein [Armatimonadota bacterium]
MYSITTNVDSGKMIMISGGLSLVIGFVLIYWYVRTKRLIDEMWAVDTYNAKDLRRMCSGEFNAMVEVEGKVTCDEPITSLAGQLPCCWYHTKVEREVRRTHHTKNGTQTTTDWQTAFELTNSTIFKVNDDTGYTLIDPTNADIDSENALSKVVCNRESWFDNASWSDTGRYRISEQVFIHGGYAYVLGQASCTGEGTSPDSLIHYPEEGYLDLDKKFFIISRKNEKALTSTYNFTVTACFWLSILCFGSALVCTLLLTGII